MTCTAVPPTHSLAPSESASQGEVDERGKPQPLPRLAAKNDEFVNPSSKGKRTSNVYAPGKKKLCRTRARHLNAMPLSDTGTAYQFHTSANPRHLRSAWVGLFEAYRPLAQYILTIRAGGTNSTTRMIEIANKFHLKCNRLVLGRDWRMPSRQRAQVAILGAVEGFRASANVHLHLTMYSRTQLFDDDIEELGLQLHDDGLANECWYMRANVPIIKGYNNYILKGFFGPDGRNLSDRMYISQSFALIRS